MAIGIIGAMEVEVDSLREGMRDACVVERAGMRFWHGSLDGTDAVVVRCGIGKVSAAACVQVLADVFEVDAVVNTGVAGSLDAAINIGDLVVATDVVHHDVDATIFGYAPGEVPQLGTASFRADERLSETIVRAAQRVAVCGADGPEDASELEPNFLTHRGRVASGDQFIADAAVKAHISEDFGASCCEMEGAAIAQTCWMNGIPFAIVRCISDKADGSDVMDYPTFEALAAARCAAVVRAAVSIC